MDIILSIYPKNIKKIEDGIKKYEFRRSIFKNKNINYVYVYATKPIKKIVSYFKIEQIISGTPDEIWQICGLNSATTKNKLFQYFKGKETVYALEIKEYTKLNKPINPKECIENFTAPQFFTYIKNGQELFKEFL